ncbi:MAG: hypothetical protein RIT26_304, partial [Pseudomonadota bacterium]
MPLSMRRQPKDAAYKKLFQSPRMVRDLVCGFIDDPWLYQLPFDRMQL